MKQVRKNDQILSFKKKIIEMRLGLILDRVNESSAN